MPWNAQVVFRATFVSRRGVIIDLYIATTVVLSYFT